MQWQRLSWLAVTLAALACESPGAKGSATPLADSSAVEVASADGAADLAAADAPAADAPGAEATNADSAPAAADVAPAVPCGNQKGKVICNVALQGYIRNESTGLASVEPYNDAFFLVEALAKVTQPYAVVLIGAWW